MQRSHKIRLVPNATQLVALKRAAGTARFTYNWAKAAWDKQYEEFKEGKAEKPDVYSICRRWTKEKPDWAREVAADLQTRAILNLGKAMINFWRKRADRPMFKKKTDRASFYVPNGKGHIKERRVHLTNIGKVKLREELRFQGRPLNYTVSTCAGAWHVSAQVELDPIIVPSSSPSVVGVDVGIKSIAVASDGTLLDNPKFLKRQQRRLAHYQRKLSRQVKGSRRRTFTKLRIAKIHSKIVNQRTDSIHKFTAILAKNHGTAVIETLDVKQMSEQGQPWLRRLLQDTAMKEVHRQLEYKMREVEKAPPFYPSSKTCSSCGDVKASLPPDIRVYMCTCGNKIDRDLNAARNLENRRWVTASSCVEGPKAPSKRKSENSGASC